MKEVRIISSKSDVHRWLIGRKLAEITGGDVPGIIYGNKSQDVFATEESLEALFPYDSMFPIGEMLHIEEMLSHKIILPCGESGSTLRFLLPIAGALGVDAEFLMKGRLPQRPLSPFKEELEAHGMKIQKIEIKEESSAEHGEAVSENSEYSEASEQDEAALGMHGEAVSENSEYSEASEQDEDALGMHCEAGSRLLVRGKLKPGVYVLPGNISSQFISGLLMALPLLDGESKIVVKGDFESRAYVDMTLNMLEGFSIAVEERGKAGEIDFIVRGNQIYTRNQAYTVEGDWSNAAFFLAAGVIGDEEVMVKGLNSDSKQGDKEVAQILRRFGAEIEEGESCLIAHPSELRGIEIDASQIPDLVPILALVATAAKGETIIKNASRLRLKESDRLKTTTEVIKCLGGDIEELDDGLLIRGKGIERGIGSALENSAVNEGAQIKRSFPLKGGRVSSFDDHRIAMMEAVASLISEEKVVIERADTVNKSYPDFFQIFTSVFGDRVELC